MALKYAQLLNSNFYAVRQQDWRKATDVKGVRRTLMKLASDWKTKKIP